MDHVPDDEVMVNRNEVFRPATRLPRVFLDLVRMMQRYPRTLTLITLRVRLVGLRLPDLMNL